MGGSCGAADRSGTVGCGTKIRRRRPVTGCRDVIPVRTRHPAHRSPAARIERQSRDVRPRTGSGARGSGGPLAHLRHPHRARARTADVREGLRPPVQALGERQQQRGVLLLRGDGLVRGPGVGGRTARTRAHGEPERVPRRGAQRVLRQDLLVRQQRDRLRAVRADHPVHLQGVVGVQLVLEGVGFDALRLGLDHRLLSLGRGSTRALDTLHGILPLRLGRERLGGHDHSKHFPSALGGNHENITEPVRMVCRSSHAARR
ncbi:hypothetical protein GPN2_12897 [Streptomyces murinus]